LLLLLSSSNTVISATGICYVLISNTYLIISAKLKELSQSMFLIEGLQRTRIQ
jgi:hypothetical protein